MVKEVEIEFELVGGPHDGAVRMVSSGLATIVLMSPGISNPTYHVYSVIPNTNLYAYVGYKAHGK